MIQIFNHLWSHKTRWAKGREEINSDLIKASPIKKQKNLAEKDNQNEVLETSFVPLKSQNHKRS